MFTLVLTLFLQTFYRFHTILLTKESKLSLGSLIMGSATVCKKYVSMFVGGV